MPSEKPVIAIRTNKEIIEKFKIISENEGRTMSKEGEYLIKNAISAYEDANGKIIIKG